jgi:hypothetical protein
VRNSIGSSFKLLVSGRAVHVRKDVSGYMITSGACGAVDELDA